MKIRGLINRLNEHMIEMKYRVFRKIYKNSKINQSVGRSSSKYALKIYNFEKLAKIPR